MPTENEVKFVLNLCKEKEFKEIAQDKVLIRQGYLLSSKGIALRCRESINHKTEYYFTFKLTSNKGRSIEIEKKIDQRDFNDLWESALNKLEKIRYYIQDSEKQLWEVDFFKDHNKENYFCMAELEMPEGQLKPKFIPKFIEKNLLYEVELKDNRFSSKMIADIKYAIELYQQLRNKNDRLFTC
jgi:CYTH domain-containing protein